MIMSLTESNCKEEFLYSAIVTVMQNVSLSSFCVSIQSLPFNQPRQK
jgi:hypothetical protein